VKQIGVRKNGAVGTVDSHKRFGNGGERKEKC